MGKLHHQRDRKTIKKINKNYNRTPESKTNQNFKSHHETTKFSILYKKEERNSMQGIPGKTESRGKGTHN